MKIKSTYVKNKLKGLKFNEKNKQYIESLVLMEQCILGEAPRGLSEGMQWHGMLEQNPPELKAIWTELDPKGYKKHLDDIKKEEQEEKDEEEAFIEEEKAEKEKEKKFWKKHGGKV